MFGTLLKRKAQLAIERDKSAHGTARPCDADTLADFVVWLAAQAETQDLSARRLRALYSEWCEFSEVTPLTDGQLFRRHKAVGIERYRETVGKRRWRYRVKSAALVALEVRRDAS